MKNALLALALFAFVGSAAAHDGKDDKGKKDKKDTKSCSAAEKGSAGCCAKKGKTAAVKPADALPTAAATKSL